MNSCSKILNEYPTVLFPTMITVLASVPVVVAVGNQYFFRYQQCFPFFFCNYTVRTLERGVLEVVLNDLSG